MINCDGMIHAQWKPDYRNSSSVIATYGCLFLQCTVAVMKWYKNRGLPWSHLRGRWSSSGIRWAPSGRGNASAGSRLQDYVTQYYRGKTFTHQVVKGSFLPTIISSLIHKVSQPLVCCSFTLLQTVSSAYQTSTVRVVYYLKILTLHFSDSPVPLIWRTGSPRWWSSSSARSLHLEVHMKQIRGFQLICKAVNQCPLVQRW